MYKHILIPTDGSELSRAAALQGVKLAQSLVRNWSTDTFDFTAYDDEYRQRVAEVIEAKVAGREIVAAEEPEPTRVLDILEALKQSLGGRPQRGKRSSRRATAVKDYLVNLGVPGNRITVVSKGKEQPFCTAETEECWQQNRRGHFLITAK